MLLTMATRHRLGLRALAAALLLAGCGGQASGAAGAWPYPSDALRVVKNGVTIVNASDPSKVADDIVYYRDHGAEQALNEIRDVLDSCTAYQQVNNEGATISVDVHKSAASSSSLGDDRVAMDRRATLGGRSIYSVVFFIRVGNYVTAIFTISGDPAEAGRLAGLAAAASTIRLKRAPA